MLNDADARFLNQKYAEKIREDDLANLKKKRIAEDCAALSSTLAGRSLLGRIAGSLLRMFGMGSREYVQTFHPVVDVVDLNNDPRREGEENPSVSAVVVGVRRTF